MSTDLAVQICLQSRILDNMALKRKRSLVISISEGSSLESLDEVRYFTLSHMPDGNVKICEGRKNKIVRRFDTDDVHAQFFNSVYRMWQLSARSAQVKKITFVHSFLTSTNKHATSPHEFVLHTMHDLPEVLREEFEQWIASEAVPEA